MDSRAAALIEQLQLRPHPEGGYFRETHRSVQQVQPGGRPRRCAVTTIYFLLLAGTYSRWHRVLADEIWHFYEGGLVDLVLAAPELEDFTSHVLGPVTPESAPVHVVPAGWWQAARPRAGYALMGCTVAPGFEFADFAFLADCAQRSVELEERRPDWATLL
jgi:uncharacterized protein